MGPKKYLGQHFLTSPAIAKKIAAAISASADEYILEIGPGHGALSIHLLEKFPRMHLVEVDTDAVNILRKKLGTGKYVIHNTDIMTFDFSTAEFPLHVIGNLPYNMGAHIIKKTLMYAPNILSCTFMVQKEVAARIVSAPHCKRNGFLSIFCQFFGITKLLFHVPPGAFFPRPNVNSSVFQITVDKNVNTKLERSLWSNFFSFVDAGFSMRRKQLAKTMALKYERNKDFYCDILSDMGINASSRPEDLDVNAWIEFYRRVN